MIAKVLYFAVLIAAAVAGNYGKDYSSQKISRYDGYPETIKCYEKIDYYAYPKYEFKYKVEDRHTGHIKSQHESHDDDHVKGYYTLHQPDGYEKSGHYKSDDHTGYQADGKYDIYHAYPYGYGH